MEKPDITTLELQLEKYLLRNLMIDDNDLEISLILANYFGAVRKRWPKASAATGTGNILPRTNGFRALTRFFAHAYRFLAAPGEVPTEKDFLSVFRKISFEDNQFTTENYKPGSSGEGQLYRDFVSASGDLTPNN